VLNAKVNNKAITAELVAERAKEASATAATAAQNAAAAAQAAAQTATAAAQTAAQEVSNAAQVAAAGASKGVYSARSWTAPRLETAADYTTSTLAPKVSEALRTAARQISPEDTRQKRGSSALTWSFLAAVPDGDDSRHRGRGRRRSQRGKPGGRLRELHRCRSEWPGVRVRPVIPVPRVIS
jgi:hypothetical protein